MGLNIYEDLRPLRRRLSWFRLATILLFSGLVLRFWQLQVVRSTDYERKAQANHVRPIPESAPRGLVLDRRGADLLETPAEPVELGLRLDDGGSLLLRVEPGLQGLGADVVRLVNQLQGGVELRRDHRCDDFLEGSAFFGKRPEHVPQRARSRASTRLLPWR